MDVDYGCWCAAVSMGDKDDADEKSKENVIFFPGSNGTKCVREYEFRVIIILALSLFFDVPQTPDSPRKISWNELSTFKFFAFIDLGIRLQYEIQINSVVKFYSGGRMLYPNYQTDAMLATPKNSPHHRSAAEGRLIDTLQFLTTGKNHIVQTLSMYFFSSASAPYALPLALGWQWRTHRTKQRSIRVSINVRIPVTRCLIKALHSDTFHIYFNIFRFFFFLFLF